MKKMCISINGKEKVWAFEFYGNPKYLLEWQADGVDVILIENEIPLWAVGMGLSKIWFFFQDLFNFKNPFKN